MAYRKIDFDGSLMHENIYRQNASAEVDAAWVALGVDCKSLGEPGGCWHLPREWLTSCFAPDRASILPPEQADKAGLTSRHVRLSEKYGGGFPANVEGLHHLHCLVRRPSSVLIPLALTPSTIEPASSIPVL